MFHELMDFMLGPSQIGGHCMKSIKPWIQKVVIGLEESFNCLLLVLTQYPLQYILVKAT
jgi:hypothetical protein